MRWIKAVNRLPPLKCRRAARYCDSTGDNAYNYTWIVVGELYINVDVDSVPIDSPYNDNLLYGWEWLDETESPSTPPLTEEMELPRHEDIPMDEMRKIYNLVQTWNEEIKPWMLKGIVQGYLLGIGKLPKYKYLTDAELDDLIQLHKYKDPGEKVPGQTPQTEERGEVPEEIPKMNDELAAQSDVAALEYSNKHGRETYSYYDNGADICDAHEAGQNWMYRMMKDQQTELLRILIIDQAKELSALQSQLIEASKDKAFYKKEADRAFGMVSRLTGMLLASKQVFQEIIDHSQNIKDNPNCRYILELAEKGKEGKA